MYFVRTTCGWKYMLPAEIEAHLVDILSPLGQIISERPWHYDSKVIFEFAPHTDAIAEILAASSGKRLRLVTRLSSNNSWSELEVDASIEDLHRFPDREIVERFLPKLVTELRQEVKRVLAMILT